MLDDSFKIPQAIEIKKKSCAMIGLAKKRQERGLTLRQAANALGLKYQTYCNYEYGHREPQIETLKAMAVFFECTIDEIL